MKAPRYTALKPRSKAAGLPEYLNSMNSTSVVSPERRHNRAKKTVVSMPPASKFHQSQFPLIPYCPTSSVTASGVSAAKVVATIEIPAMYQGNDLPPRKYSLMDDFLLRPKYIPISTVAASNEIRTVRSMVLRFMCLFAFALEELGHDITTFLLHNS